MATDMHACDVVVIGAGIAGASVAAELAAARSVVLLERESQPGYHTTGRSAALFSRLYGPEPIRALSRASGAFYTQPPAGFASAPLLRPRQVALVAREDQTATVAAEYEAVRHRGAVDLVDARELRAMMPLLRDGYAAGALIEREAADIDVHALHHGYLRQLRARGGRVETSSEVVNIERDDGGWTVGTARASYRAPVVVNAAGAWADEIARLAGVTPVGLAPKRRTALIVDAPGGQADEHWPMVVDIDEAFYLKPDAGRLLISPADETPSPPCDAQPEEIDIAICIDRIEQAFDLEIRAIVNRWAGLRSFVADKAPVAGYDPGADGFFWLAGQGGYGIQTAPALARAAAALVTGDALPDDIAAEGVEMAALAPARLGKEA